MRVPAPIPLRPRLLAAAALALLSILLTTAITAAVLTSDPGPFTGCLGVKTNKGLVYNTAPGSQPLTPCSRGDVQIQFSNAAGPQGEPGPTGPPGPQGEPGGSADVSALTATIEALQARIADLETKVALGTDVDGDTWTGSRGDCDDSNSRINPVQRERPDDGVDDNCNGVVDEPVFLDVDFDGYTSLDDCDDFNFDINPGAAEIPDNGIDENCNGILDEQPGDDSDEDGYPYPEDCDDTNAAINPGAVEIINGLDDDCDGALGFWFDDSGVGACQGGTYAELPDGTRSPTVGAAEPTTEIPDNGIDEDCDGMVDEVD